MHAPNRATHPITPKPEAPARSIHVLDLVRVIDAEILIPPILEVRDSDLGMQVDTINRPTEDLSQTPLEAELPLPRIAPTRDDRDTPLLTPAVPVEQVSRTPSRTIPSPDGPELQRDREIVIAVSQHRLLSYQQLHSRLFPNTHRAVVGRRMQALEAAGWLRIWEERVPKGGHPRYALPSKKALLWARRVLLAEHANATHAPLVATMLRDKSPEPLPLDDATPPFLAHQRETNDVLLALQRANRAIAWSSSWHRPLPNEYASRSLPQPDGVLVIGTPAGPRLLFLEHDRGREPVGTFKAAKAARYAAFKHSPADLERLTGFRSFEVLVTVHAPEALKRIAELQHAVRTTYGASMFRFTVDSWLLDAPDAAIWFDDATAPEITLGRDGQRGLLPLPGCSASPPHSPGETPKRAAHANPRTS